MNGDGAESDRLTVNSLMVEAAASLCLTQLKHIIRIIKMIIQRLLLIKHNRSVIGS